MINKIEGLGGVRQTQPTKRVAKPGATSGASFARHMGDDEETSAVGGMSGATSVGGILGVQEVDDALAHASKGKMRAESILDKLEDLRMQLLSGAVSKEKLIQLSHMVNTRRGQITDPKLVSILDDIDLRAQVELAKYAP